MSNEFLFILSVVVNIVFIFIAARKGIEWLLGAISANLILVGIFGAKLITIFGLTTNVGNIFYACVFLATHFIIERYGRKVGQKTIWYGLMFILFFVAMSWFATQLIGISTNKVGDNSMGMSFSVRLIVASMLGYVFSQCVNIAVYDRIKIWTNGKFLWLRSNCANIISQFLDSVLFFSIAFFDLSGPVLVQTILAGWIIKIVVVAMGTPFLYLDKYLNKNK